MYVKLNGEKVSFDVCVEMMDDNLREYLHTRLAPCTEQYFLDEYCKEHKNKYGVQFTI